MKEHEDIAYDLSPISLPRYTMEDIVGLLDIWSGLRQAEEMISTMINGGPGIVIDGGPLGMVKEVANILSRISLVYDMGDDETVNAFYALLYDKTMSNEQKARKLMGM